MRRALVWCVHFTPLTSLACCTACAACWRAKPQQATACKHMQHSSRDGRCGYPGLSDLLLHIGVGLGRAGEGRPGVRCRGFLGSQSAPEQMQHAAIVPWPIARNLPTRAADTMATIQRYSA